MTDSEYQHIMALLQGLKDLHDLTSKRINNLQNQINLHSQQIADLQKAHVKSIRNS